MLTPKSLVTIGILLISGLNFCYSQRGEKGDPRDIFESCIKRRTCQSNNDPHMVSFDNYHFEFQVDGSHCLANSDLYTVQAQFEQCNSVATCNCKVEVSLPNGDFAYIDNCGTGSMQIDTVQTSTGPVPCVTVTNPLFNPFTESHWNLVSSGNGNFECVQFNSYTYIKTQFSDPADNVIVQVSGGMNSVNVIVPPSFSPTKECLCDVSAASSGRRRRSVENVKHISLEEIARYKYFEKCDYTLKPEKLRESIAKLENDGLNARLDNYVQNCAVDAEMIEGIDLGKFQKDDARADICQVVLNQPVEQAAEFLRNLGLGDDLIKNIQQGSENGFEACVKYISSF